MKVLSLYQHHTTTKVHRAKITPLYTDPVVWWEGVLRTFPVGVMGVGTSEGLGLIAGLVRFADFDVGGRARLATRDGLSAEGAKSRFSAVTRHRAALRSSPPHLMQRVWACGPAARTGIVRNASREVRGGRDEARDRGAYQPASAE